MEALAKTPLTMLVVDHWRTLITFIRLVHDKEEDGSSICHARRCSKMSAGG
jgi:hypothetical protein